MAGDWARVADDLEKCSSGNSEKRMEIRHVVKVAPMELADAHKGQAKDAACFLHLAKSFVSMYPPSSLRGARHHSQFTKVRLKTEPKRGVSTVVTSDWSRTMCVSLLWHL